MNTTPMQDLITSLTSGFSSTVSDVISAIGSVAPIALPILGAMIVIGVAIAVFKKVSKSK